jgi:hypothetical protein
VWGDHLYFVDQNGADADLMRVDPSGQVELVVDAIAPASVDTALAFRPDGKALYVGVGSRLFRVLPARMQLQASPNPASPGQLLTIATTGGFAGQPTLLLADRLLALRFEPPLILLSGGMDAIGSWGFSFAVPGGLAGLDVRIQTLSLDAGGDLLASNKLVMQFQ